MKNTSITAMMFEYIRPIDPRAAHLELAPVLIQGSSSDVPDLAELVARARKQAPDDESSLACPVALSRRFELPWFSGIALADMVLQTAATSPVPVFKPTPAPAPERLHEPLPVIAPLPPEPRVLLGPGAMTMTLALVATLVFGVLVVTH